MRVFLFSTSIVIQILLFGFDIFLFDSSSVTVFFFFEFSFDHFFRRACLTSKVCVCGNCFFLVVVDKIKIRTVKLFVWGI